MLSPWAVQLLSYREGSYDPQEALGGLAPPMRALVLHMIQLDPGQAVHWPSGTPAGCRLPPTELTKHAKLP